MRHIDPRIELALWWLVAVAIFVLICSIIIGLMGGLSPDVGEVQSHRSLSRVSP